MSTAPVSEAEPLWSAAKPATSNAPRIENSQKAAQGVHLTDLARYLDVQRERAVLENDKLHNRAR